MGEVGRAEPVVTIAKITVFGDHDPILGVSQLRNLVIPTAIAVWKIRGVDAVMSSSAKQLCQAGG